jgi:hypothetical protein
MYFISHRGNVLGPNPKKENSISYIKEALSNNFDVEVDVWLEGKKFFLGHNKPEYKVSLNFLSNSKLWLHAKNLECFYMLSKYNLNYFWHEKDKITITSKGFFWNYPGTILSKKSICVLPELNKETKNNCSGFCSDYIKIYYDRYNNF